jgi:hypothetical protein
MLLPSNAVAVALSIANTIPISVTVTITVTIAVTITIAVAITIAIAITITATVIVAITLAFAFPVTIATSTADIFAAVFVACQRCCHHRNKYRHRHHCLFGRCIHCPAAVVANRAAINTVIPVVAIINNAVALAFPHYLGRRRSRSQFICHSC